MKTIKYSDYYDKALGCWLGKSIGGACGALSENNKDILHYTLDNVFPDTIPPNDDLDLQVLWLLDLLEKKGTELISYDFAKSFAEHNICLANEYATAIKNIQGAIMPPYSGVFANDYFKNSMGCPIRSEIWAVVAPYSFETVKKYVVMDGSVDHDSESIYAEVFNAVMESAAFFEDDLKTLVNIALTQIPENSLCGQVARLSLDCYEKGKSWEQARAQIIINFGAQDASYSVVNIGLTLISLLYGEKDFTKTLLYAVNGGFDTDCTAATALSLLGIIVGGENIPEFWLNKIGEELVVGTVDLPCPYKTIKSFTEASCRAGLSFQEEGLLDVEITDIPEGVTPSLPKSNKKEITLFADYEGEPSIGIGESKEVYISITNNVDTKICNSLKITPPESLTCQYDCGEIEINPKETAKIKVVFSAKDNLEFFPIDLISKVSFGDESIDVGLCGAFVMKMVGPFWDNYDTTLYDSNPYNERKQQKPSGEEDTRAMFSGFVNINKEYIDEDFANLEDIINGKTDAPCKTVNLHGDIFDLENHITYKGPACVYLVYDFDSEKDVWGNYHFGNTAPFKVWENGKLIVENDIHCSWTPYNVNVPAYVKKGRNRIIFKIMRNDAFRFSFCYRDEADELRYYHATKSVL